MDCSGCVAAHTSETEDAHRATCVDRGRVILEPERGAALDAGRALRPSLDHRRGRHVDRALGRATGLERGEALPGADQLALRALELTPSGARSIAGAATLLAHGI